MGSNVGSREDCSWDMSVVLGDGGMDLKGLQLEPIWIPELVGWTSNCSGSLELNRGLPNQNEHLSMGNFAEQAKRDIVLAAVANDGFAVRHASDALRADREAPPPPFETLDSNLASHSRWLILIRGHSS